MQKEAKSFQTKSFYEFDQFRIDPINRLLFRDNEIVPLTAKVFDILLVFVENSGKLLKKDEVMQQVWRDSFVEEGNLTRNVSTLRKALGDDPKAHQYIVTIPGRGYQFVAEVKKLTAETATLLIEEHTTSSVVINQEVEIVDRDAKAVDKPSFREFIRFLDRHRLWFVSATIGLLAIVIFFAFRPRKEDSTSFASLQPTLIATWKIGQEEKFSNVRFSPDGKMIAYAAPQSGKGQAIFIKQTAASKEYKVTNDEWSNRSPVWSPNGESLAFISERENQIGIWVSPILGGNQSLLKNIEGKNTLFLKQWSKDGSTIFYEAEGNLFALKVHSKEIEQLTNFDSSSIITNFSLSPNEEFIAYQKEEDKHFEIWVSPKHGGTPIRLTNPTEDSRYPYWLDNERLVFSSERSGNTDRTGAYQICIAYIDGREPVQITNGEGSYEIADVAADGSKILYSATQETSAIWGVKIDSGQEFEVSASFNFALGADVSPDGKTLAFQSTNAPLPIYGLMNGAIMTQSLLGDGQETRLAVKGYEVRWSPDNSKMAFLRYTDVKRIADLCVIGRVGGEVSQITTEGITFGGYSQMLPYNRVQTKDYSWSPDSSKIAYCSNESGAANVWTIVADGSSKNNISKNTDATVNFVCPLWSPVGNRIAYISYSKQSSPDAKRVWSLCVAEEEKSRTIFSNEAPMKLLGWSASGNQLVVSALADNNSSGVKEVTLLQIALDGSNRPLAHVKAAYFSNIQLSFDGNAIAFTSRQDGKDNIWIVDASGGEARKITTNDDAKLYFSSLSWSPDGKTIYYSKQISRSLISMFDNVK